MALGHATPEPHRPVYPVRRLLTGEEAAKLHPSELVWFGGFAFANVRGEWCFVDVLAPDDLS